VWYFDSFAAGLPKFRGFNVRGNPDYPNTAAWFDAIAARPSYQRVCSDDQTLQLLFQRMMGLSPSAAAAASSSSAAAAAAAAMAAFAASPADDTAAAGSNADKAATQEAADKLQSCLADVIRDILSKSGVTRYQSSPYGATTRSVNGHMPR
jgi:primase-polymerase (primpol)-like protein